MLNFPININIQVPCKKFQPNCLCFVFDIFLVYTWYVPQIKNLWDIVPAEPGARFLSMLPQQESMLMSVLVSTSSSHMESSKFTQVPEGAVFAYSNINYLAIFGLCIKHFIMLLSTITIVSFHINCLLLLFSRNSCNLILHLCDQMHD